MPGETYVGTPLAQAVNNSQVSIARLDDMITRMLTSMYTVGVMDSPNPTGLLLSAHLSISYCHIGNLQVNVTSAAHNDLARFLSEVCLKGKTRKKLTSL